MPVFHTAHVGIQNRVVYLQNFGTSLISLVNGGDYCLSLVVWIG